jgi:hypothetical protein
VEREEESGSSERTIWIEQCGAGRWDNEWQGGGELLSCRRKAQMQSNGYFLSSTCSIGTLTLQAWFTQIQVCLCGGIPVGLMNITWNILR